MNQTLHNCLVPEKSSRISNTLNALIGKICLYYLQLKERDARGNTPFMTAVQCHNFKAAIYILDFVESNKGIVQSYAIICKISLKKKQQILVIILTFYLFAVCRQHHSKLAVFDEGHDLS